MKQNKKLISPTLRGYLREIGIVPFQDEKGDLFILKIDYRDDPPKTIIRTGKNLPVGSLDEDWDSALGGWG